LLSTTASDSIVTPFKGLILLSYDDGSYPFALAHLSPVEIVIATG